LPPRIMYNVAMCSTLSEKPYEYHREARSASEEGDARVR